jgi:glycosyltransferase involved in cell wall biosynthesis
MNAHTDAKGRSLLLSEFADVRSRLDGCELHLYGTDQRSEPERGIHAHGAYRPDDLDAILARFDVGVIPSLWEEAYAYVGPEMLSRGLPLIVSSRGAMTEYTRHEVNGLVFDPGIPGSLTGAMVRIAEDKDLRARLSEAAVRSGEGIQEFTPHLTAMENIYAELLSKASPPGAVS